MVKKIAAFAAAGAMVLAVAGPAFAALVEKNVAIVGNEVTAVASTGVIAGNAVIIDRAGINGDVEVGGANIVKQLSTGDADALAGGAVVANTRVGCGACGPSFYNKDVAKVGNVVGAQAETGVQAGGVASVSRAHVDGEVEVEGVNVVKQLHTGDSNSRAFGIVVVNTRWGY